MKTNGIQWNSIEFPMRSKVSCFSRGEIQEIASELLLTSWGGGGLLIWTCHYTQIWLPSHFSVIQCPARSIVRLGAPNTEPVGFALIDHHLCLPSQWFPGTITRRSGNPTTTGFFSGSGSKLVGGWATPLKNMKVNWDDYSEYMGK